MSEPVPQSKPERFLRLLLRPILRLCIRRALSFQEFSTLAKIEFVRVASEELQSGESSSSKLSVMTGIRRPDIIRILKDGFEDDGNTPLIGNIITKIIGAWLYDKQFCSSPGKPKSLTFVGKESEFALLVRRVTSDVSHHTVLFELERLGAIDRKENSVSLQARANIDREQIGEGYFMLAEDAADLIESVDENLRRIETVPNLHARTMFDNIDAEDVPEIRAWILERGRKFHDEVRAFLAGKDRDLTPGKRQSAERSRISFVTFSNIRKFARKADSSRRKK